MDFNVKKLASDAGVFFTRAVQYTEEKLGQAEKTELDAHLENLLARGDCTKNWTEKIFRQTEILLQPNPIDHTGARIEEFLYEKLEKKIPLRITNAEVLGQYMQDAAKEFGPSTPYGSTLITVGEYQKRIGAVEREFIHASAVGFLNPLRNFLEGDWRIISKERRLLENYRLDLDACKARLKKAKLAEAKAAATPDFQETRPRNYVLSASASALWSEEVEKAEQELRVAQTDFDRQSEVTRLLLEGINSTHVNHLRCLHEFVKAQAAYFAQCAVHMQDLQKELSRGGLEVAIFYFNGTKLLSNIWNLASALGMCAPNLTAAYFSCATNETTSLHFLFPWPSVQMMIRSPMPLLETPLCR
ncbi:endophilin-B2b isoform X12 [Electrophorus electricus]|uniref:endophilin-B2b isoform X12 n=1 Tax=Electrophorus electricus TaxID=8005 RepID=UPI0015D0C9F4|nr:endophilin-B2b isoform X12 [Electrophorus electricus]